MNQNNTKKINCIEKKKEIVINLIISRKKKLKFIGYFLLIQEFHEPRLKNSLWFCYFFLFIDFLDPLLFYEEIVQTPLELMMIGIDYGFDLDKLSTVNKQLHEKCSETEMVHLQNVNNLSFRSEIEANGFRVTATATCAFLICKPTIHCKE